MMTQLLGMKMMVQRIPHWTAAISATNADYALGVHVADMDNDGDLDIVSVSQLDDTIAWYENNGAANPTWTLQI